jgi:hypothetical protein
MNVEMCLSWKILKFKFVTNIKIVSGRLILVYFFDHATSYLLCLYGLG